MCPIALVVGLALLAPASADEPKADPKPDTKPTSKSSDEITTSSHLGDVVGVVVKVESGSITIKVPEVVANGTTTKRVGGHTVAVPKLTTKQVEVSYTLADKVVVKTVSGKESDLASVTKDTAVELHIDKVRTGKVGEKLESHLEVKRIDVPDAPASKK